MSAEIFEKQALTEVVKPAGWLNPAFGGFFEHLNKTDVRM